MLRAFYIKYIKHKLFNKIFITFSAITTVSFLLFAYMTLVNISVYYRNKIIEANEQALSDAVGYIEQKIGAATDIIQNLYTNPSLYTEILYLMENGYNKHLEYKLDNFFSSRENRYNGFENYFHSCLTRDSGLIGICIYSGGQDKAFVYSAQSRIIYPKDSRITNYLNESPRDSTNPKVIPAHPVSYFVNGPNQTMAFSMAYGVKERFTSKTIGFIVLDYGVDGVAHACARKNSLFEAGTAARSGHNYQGNIVALTPKGEVIFDLSGLKYGALYPDFQALKNGKKNHPIYMDNIIHTTVSANTGILAAAILPEGYVDKAASSSNRTIFLIALTCIIAILLFTAFAIRAFSKRTGVVMEGIKKIRQGDLSARIFVKNDGDELSEIALSFNATCEDLNTYINRVYLAEINRKNAQIKALQAQINPHFLYNTLESIRMRILASGAREAGDMIYLLASLFRYSVKEEMVISIHEEIKYARMYLALHNIRFGEQIAVDFDIAEETLDLGIIKHTIQPVIENYIIHGMNPTHRDNWLKVTISKNNQAIQIRITDNGAGIPEEKLAGIVASLEKNGEEKAHTGGANIGLANVNERIKLLFGPGYGLTIQSREGEGTTVAITMPAIPGEDMKRYV
ncbi:MAG TPA: sensor histidine kinase [Bacillota bacterium]|nr:sensor histidine kinase [Bacillota bacterium]